MIKKLIEDYGDFHDCLLTEINYFNGYNFSKNTFENITLKVTISCYNLSKEYGSLDLITILCEDISLFIYNKTDGMIYEAMIKEENGKITLDFAYETEMPYFVIECGKVSYEVIEQKQASH